VRQGDVGAGSTTVRLKLEDGSDYPLTGRVQFSELTVEENTGTVTLRASFPNPDGLLLPGMFVNAVFDQAVQPSAFLVPQPALQRDFDGSAFVFVVGADNKAQRRKVTAARTSGTNWVITAGLRAGDRVITQGLGTNVRHDAVVRPVPANAAQRVVPPGRGAGAPSGASRPG
jgi:membrane fusion protein (multidrug efflux system)